MESLSRPKGHPRKPSRFIPFHCGLRDLLLGTVYCAACASTPTPAPVGTAGPSEHHHAVVTHAEGVALTAGTACVVTITKQLGGSYNCRVELRCTSEVFYGLPGAGFNRCTYQDGHPVTASDSHPTRRDGDPMMELDLTQGSLVIQDSAPPLLLTIAIHRR